jgi:ribonuclease P protein component
VRNETNFSAEYPSPQEDARVPDPDADAGWPGSDCAAAGKRPGAPVGVAGGVGAHRAHLQRYQAKVDGRLTSPQEFRWVLRSGRRWKSGALAVHVRDRDGGGQPRLGLVVPRAVGTAVVRNQLKRRIRAIWREVKPVASPIDCVVVVRGNAARLTYGELAGQLGDSLVKMRVLEMNP